MAASPVTTPEEEEVALKNKTQKVREPKPEPASPKPPPRDLVHRIFEGHEDFLGWTPD